jgi:hypothetical protein
MPASASVVDRARLRRSLLQLASILMLALLTVTLLALFSVWSLNRVHERSAAALTELIQTVDEGRSAQSHYKTQVQEWKNILLRGSDAGDRARHLGAFEREGLTVQTLLESVNRRVSVLGIEEIPSRIKQLEADHVELQDKYRAALDGALRKPWDPFSIDRSVRGVDRQLNAELDEVMLLLASESFQLNDRAAAENARRFSSLTQLLWLTMCVALLLIGMLLWRVLNDRALR